MSALDNLSDEIESILFIAREVMVYQVPPRTSASGYKASEWNVESFIWKGRLRIIERGPQCEIRLEDPNTGELFASVKYAFPWTSVEPVLDSSRYFVLTVEGEGGKRAFVGMGFAERGESFDFQVSLQSVSKRSNKTTGTQETSNKPAAPVKDYSLKDGQTFTINIPGRDRKKDSSSIGAGSGGGGGGGGGLFSLPPPPPPGGGGRRS